MAVSTFNTSLLFGIEIPSQVDGDLGNPLPHWPLTLPSRQSASPPDCLAYCAFAVWAAYLVWKVQECMHINEIFLHLPRALLFLLDRKLKSIYYLYKKHFKTAVLLGGRRVGSWGGRGRDIKCVSDLKNNSTTFNANDENCTMHAYKCARNDWRRLKCRRK